jgi:hypothetical protein
MQIRNFSVKVSRACDVSELAENGGAAMAGSCHPAMEVDRAQARSALADFQ